MQNRGSGNLYKKDKRDGRDRRDGDSKRTTARSVGAAARGAGVGTSHRVTESWGSGGKPPDRKPLRLCVSARDKTAAGWRGAVEIFGGV